MEEVKEWLLNVLAGPLQYTRAMNHLDTCNGVLLYGPPGTGKSMLARSLASKINIPFIEITGSHLNSKWHGESEANIRKFFAMAAEFAPCIVFIGKCTKCYFTDYKAIESYITLYMEIEITLYMS